MGRAALVARLKAATRGPEPSQLLSAARSIAVAPAVMPHSSAPAPDGPPGPLANAMAALPPVQIAPEVSGAEKDEEEADDALYQLF